VDRVLAAAASAGICAGILSPTADAARQRAEQGFRFLAVGSDSTLLAAATSDLVARLTPNDTSEQGAS
jgi:4-hydroxy-2-oxoheptanedioate aldolase